jgi:hypothetical protein
MDGNGVSLHLLDRAKKTIQALIRLSITAIHQGDNMNLQSHIEALKGRHASLESRIAAEDSRPRPDDTMLSRMKVEKLRLKEEMERLKTQ